MKVTCLLGSPRVKGNSEIIANAFLEETAKHGENKVFALNKLQYKGCQGCMGCKTKHEECVVKDGFTEVLDTVKETDVLVLVSPIYYGDITSQLKAFIDRTFCYFVPDSKTNPNPSRLKKSGKKLVFILVQGHPDENAFADVFSKYTFFLKWYGFEEFHLIRGVGLGDKGEASSRQDLLEKAKEVAKKVMNVA